ncbi:MAG TPA: hypothetical protein PLY86_13660 [bacterium]|nr:hypothetical protein [bacterium]
MFQHVQAEPFLSKLVKEVTEPCQEVKVAVVVKAEVVGKVVAVVVKAEVVGKVVAVEGKAAVAVAEELPPDPVGPVSARNAEPLFRISKESPAIRQNARNAAP